MIMAMKMTEREKMTRGQMFDASDPRLIEDLTAHCLLYIIGAGAAGCFAAVNIKEMAPDIEVHVFESGNRPMTKLSITGGGRCNITNTFSDIRSIEEAYPRGARLMKRLLKEFGSDDTCRWFREHGVRLVTQPDQRVFPASQDALEVVGVLKRLMAEYGVRLHTGSRIGSVKDLAGQCDTVLVTTGGMHGRAGSGMFDGLDLEIVPPVPSLYSFNVDVPELKTLTGTVVEKVTAGISGTKFRADGPVLITDWGMSGPAILKLSSYAARYLAENQYRATLVMNWCGSATDHEVEGMLQNVMASNGQRQLVSVHPDWLNSRLWQYLLHRAGLKPSQRCAEVGQKGLRRLTAVLVSDEYAISGRNRFKGEFVTCGGVALQNIDPGTLECRQHPGLYFAGEVLDVDAITGGFNLQAAWTTGYVAARSIAHRHESPAAIAR